jgi:hypothetical protein
MFPQPTLSRRRMSLIIALVLLALLLLAAILGG